MTDDERLREEYEAKKYLNKHFPAHYFEPSIQEDLLKAFVDYGQGLKATVTSTEEPFTKDEEAIMKLIVEAHNKMVEIQRTHPNEIQEWVLHIHGLQSLLAMRVMRRRHPGYFVVPINDL